MSWQHIQGWVQVTEPEPGEPVDPGFGRPGWSPVDPGYGRPGWSPVDPGYGRPGFGGRPDNSLPIAPVRPGNKPPGRPILPPTIDNKPPTTPAHPWIPGHWEILDPGWGKPPLLGFLPTDPGFGIEELPPTGPKPPGGVWVPTDPDFGKPVLPSCPGGKPHPPLWAWIPDRPDFGGKPTPSPTTTTVYPATVTPAVGGGSGSVNVTTDPVGSWTVDATTVPAWVTVNPMSSQTSDVNVTYSVGQNTTGAARSAVIKINDATLTINQAGA